METYDDNLSIKVRRGWRTRTNLYYDFKYEPLLTEPVKSVRAQIGLAAQ